MKNKEYIGKLLRKFMQAETSEQQESELADYFCHSKNIPEEWEAYKQYFKAFDSEEASSSNNGYPTPLLRRHWYYAVACVAATFVCAVALRYALYTSENCKRLTIETPVRIQPTESTKAKDTTVVSKNPMATIGERQEVSEKVCMKRGGYGKSRRADRADYVPVPKPVAATEARHYVATSTETMIEEPSHQIKTADINASVAYIQSKGENLERQVLASKGDGEYHMHINKDLEQNL